MDQVHLVHQLEVMMLRVDSLVELLRLSRLLLLLRVLRLLVV